MVAFTANLSLKAKTDIANIFDKTDKTCLNSFKAMLNLQKEPCASLQDLVTSPHSYTKNLKSMDWHFEGWVSIFPSFWFPILTVWVIQKYKIIKSMFRFVLQNNLHKYCIFSVLPRKSTADPGNIC